MGIFSSVKAFWKGTGVALVVCFGVGISLFLRRSPPADEKAAREALEYRDGPPAASKPSGDPPAVAESTTAPASWPPIQFPAGAIGGELVLHFDTDRDYRRYLKALREAGLSPLDRIDALQLVRVPIAALSGPDPQQFGARPSVSFEVVHPPPPERVAPEVLTGLRAYGASARAIVGGDLGGDGAGVRVGVLDSGMQAHPQFEGSDVAGIDLTEAGVSGKGAAHGTAVSSIISGAEGIAPEATVLAVRILNDAGEGNERLVDRGAQVLNLSVGAYEDTPAVREAVRYAADQGVLMVASAGNEGYPGLPFPAAYPEVLAVTAVDATGRQAVFPNQSEHIDLAAPGVGVRAAKGEAGTVLFSGTSAAAPFVSGTLVALLSATGTTAREAEDVLRRNLNEAGAPGPDALYGSGVVDWNRLREQGTPGIIDAALADIHVAPGAVPGTTAPVEVIVQNQGTTRFSEANLEVVVGEGEPVDFVIEALGPGEVATRKVYVQTPASSEAPPLSVAARILPETLGEDVRLGNNFRALMFRPGPAKAD